MRPVHLQEGTPPPPRTLGVDGGCSGCARVYSHWPGQRVPEEIAADTSTAILLRAARDPQRWLAGFDFCGNDHLDTDGLLAQALACRPELVVRHGPLMVAAAAYGDFCAWHGADGARLALRLHQLLRHERDLGGAWEQRAMERVVDDLEELVAESREADEEREAQIAQILRVRELAAGDDERVVLQPRRLLTVVRCRHEHGHHADGPDTVHQEDDCPPWALDGLIDRSHLQLLVFTDADGAIYQLDAPRHSWAVTVHLPRVAWPDVATAAVRLQDLEAGAARWVVGDEARRRGFTCLLATVDGSGAPARSRLGVDQVVAAVEASL